MEDVFDQRGFAASRDSGHRDKKSERDLDIEVAQVMLARAFDANHASGIHAPTDLGDRNLDLSAQVPAGDRLIVGAHFVDGSLGDDQSTVLSCSRPQIDEMVSCLHRLLVVLDDDDGVAEIAELPQGVQQTGVVALVEPDRRLVEDVKDAHQA